MGYVSPNACMCSGGSSSRALRWCELFEGRLPVLSMPTGTHACGAAPTMGCVWYVSVSWHGRRGDVCDVCVCPVCPRAMW